MRSPTEVLSRLQEKAKDKTYRFERLYRNLYNPEFYMLAYQKVYSNKGSMTPGVDGSTMDGMSSKRIEGIIASLRDESYHPAPARRTYIAKKNNPAKKRPLGIPSGNDKLVQEVVRIILEAIYEPVFSNHSHGFRPNKSCHSALLDIQHAGRGCTWFIEGDITACFDSFDHHVLINLLRKRINDEKLLALMWKFLKAGYMDQWEHFDTFTGTPQGSGMSPVLANIYLHELDSFMKNMQERFNTGSGDHRKTNPKFSSAVSRYQRYEKKNAKLWPSLTDAERSERAKTLRQMKLDAKRIPSRFPNDTTFKQVKHIRYADDFLVCVWGGKKDAERIKEEIGTFLEQELHLTLSDSKTRITHATEKARFLGYDICVTKSQDTRRDKKGNQRRVFSGNVILLVPHEKWYAKLLACHAISVRKNENGKDHYRATQRTELINRSDIEILRKYDAEVRGLYNYYSIANNACVIGHFGSLMKWSMLKTFAGKYRTRASEIKKRYTVNGAFTVSYMTKKGTKQASFYNGGYERRKFPSLFANPDNTHLRGMQLAGRIRAGMCEMCGSVGNVEVHQVKSISVLKGRLLWECIMLDKRRKTLVVCPSCHERIHS